MLITKEVVQSSNNISETLYRGLVKFINFIETD
jgi:hypothetical protein